MTWRLYVDIGNTNVRWGAYANDRWLAEGRFPSSLLSQNTVNAHLRHPLELAGVAICDVAGIVGVTSKPEAIAPIEQIVRAICGKPLALVGRDLQPDIAADYYDPSRIGVDRLVDALAARELYGAPCVVLTFGTCLTCEAVSADGRITGGAIAPGLPIISAGFSVVIPRLRRPFEKAIQAAPADAPGRDTTENMRLGCVGGLAAVADYLASQARQWVGEQAPIVATGGDAPLVTPICRSELAVNPMLTLEGLRLIDVASRAG